MIKIERVRAGDVVGVMSEIVEHLVFRDESQEAKALFAKQLVEGYSDQQQSVFFIVARHQNEVIGYVIAQNLPDCIFINQAWSRKGNPWSVADEMFLRTLMWGTALGKTAIRAETRRDVDSFYRRMGFEEVSVIIERKIGPEILTNVLARAREVFNGKPV